MSPKSPSSSTTSSASPCPPHPQAAENSASAGSSLTTIVNFSRTYARTLQTNSFKEMWSKIHSTSASPKQVLDPDPVCVEDALRHAKSNTLTALAKPYFDSTEKAAHLCHLLLRSVSTARGLYAGLHAFLPLDSDSPSHSSFTQSQCNRAFDLFREFDRPVNPFASHHSDSFDDMHHCFSQLKKHLYRRLRKSRSRIDRLRSWGRCCRCSHCHSNEAARMAQLDDVLSSTIVLNEELNTVDCLVRRLCGAVDDDKSLVRMALERDSEKHFIINIILTDVVKDFRKNHQSFQELEERICICFISINNSRALLLQEIRLHHTLVSRHYRHRQGGPSAVNSHENFVYGPG